MHYTARYDMHEMLDVKCLWNRLQNVTWKLKQTEITIFQTFNADLPLNQDDTCMDLQVPGSTHIHEIDLHNLDMAIPTHVLVPVNYFWIWNWNLRCNQNF